MESLFSLNRISSRGGVESGKYFMHDLLENKIHRVYHFKVLQEHKTEGIL